MAFVSSVAIRPLSVASSKSLHTSWLGSRNSIATLRTVRLRQSRVHIHDDQPILSMTNGAVPVPQTFPPWDGKEDSDQTTIPNIEPGFSKSIMFQNHKLSYDYIPGTTPTILFLPGFYFSRWRQVNSNALEIFAKRRGQAIIVEEYVGTGNTGNFAEDGTLSRWIEDTCLLIDCIEGPVLLVGAGVGGWIMLHVAMRRSDRVIGLVGVNPSVDFTHDLVGPALTDEQNDTIEKNGVVDVKWGYRIYPISKRLMEDAGKWLVLRDGKGSLPIACPVRLFQGLADEEIPPTRILKLVDTLKGDDCIVSFTKSGDHFLEDESDVRRLTDAICEISDNFYEYDLTSPGSG